MVLSAVADGAVYRPAFVTVPAVVDQVTPVLMVPTTLAANCFVAPEMSVVAVGEMETVIRVGLTANANIEHRTTANPTPTCFISSF